jgi:hypothetical protein
VGPRVVLTRVVLLVTFSWTQFGRYESHNTDTQYPSMARHGASNPIKKVSPPNRRQEVQITAATLRGFDGTFIAKLRGNLDDRRNSSSEL